MSSDVQQGAISTTFGKQINIRVWVIFAESEWLKVEGTCGGESPLLEWDHLKPVAQDPVQTAFEYLEG